MVNKLDRIAFGLFVLATVSLSYSEALAAILFVPAVVAAVVYFKTR